MSDVKRVKKDLGVEFWSPLSSAQFLTDSAWVVRASAASWGCMDEYAACTSSA